MDEQTKGVNGLGIHRFYHADRARTLTERQEIALDDRGLSRFGAAYWDAINSKRFEDMNDAEQREYLLEQIKSDPRFNAYTSRMKAIFGANSIEEARFFARSINPRPEHKIPIYEIYASIFWTLDTNWLDYTTNHENRIKYFREYWYAAISNHNPDDGERKPPSLEVLIALPARVGEVVDWV
jgi:hypothetical protein